MYICIYRDVTTYICIYVYNLYKCKYNYIYMYIYICMCIYVFMIYVFMYTCLYLYTNMFSADVLYICGLPGFCENTSQIATSWKIAGCFFISKKTINVFTSGQPLTSDQRKVRISPSCALP